MKVNKKKILILTGILIICVSAINAGTVNTNALVLVNSESSGYPDFASVIVPYLMNFGIPYTVHDIAAQPVTQAALDCAVIIIGHERLNEGNGSLNFIEQEYIRAAVASGAGLVNFDGLLNEQAPHYSFINTMLNLSYGPSLTIHAVDINDNNLSIHCWNDTQQSPVLITTTNGADLNAMDGQWTEFYYAAGKRPFPSVFAGVNEENYGLPVMRFSLSNVPDGEYEIIANLYTQAAGRDMRYYYGFSAGSAKSDYVDTVGGSGGKDQHTEYSLGQVSITGGNFSIYVKDADLIGTGTYPFFGWAYIRLLPKGFSMTGNCWEDTIQSPVLSTTTNASVLNSMDGQWTEFHYVAGGRPFPSVFAGVNEENYGLPVMRFSLSNIPDGKYEIFAYLYTQAAGRDMRYYYGFSAGAAKSNYVDTIGGSGGSDQHTAYSLGKVSITGGNFSLYVKDADLIGAGTYPFFGWARIWLVYQGQPFTINCWQNHSQDPDLATTTNAAALNITDGQWTEFHYVAGGRPFPSVFAGVNEEDYGLPVMRFSQNNIPEGRYEIIANLYTQAAGRDMRYYYGFSPVTPKSHYVDTIGGSGGSDQHTEYSLGHVTVTNGNFNLYVQDADLTGTGTYPFFGWAHIKLVYKGSSDYITALRTPDNAYMNLATPIILNSTLIPPANAGVIATADGAPFIVTREYGQGRAVQWASYDFTSTDVRGYVYGFDDLVWRSIVWAARKPFVMQGMPPLLTFRIDDCTGPFWWAQDAAAHGLKPWLGLFLNDIDSSDTAIIKDLVDAGSATTSIHAYKSNQWFYFNHNSGTDFSQNIVDNNFAVGTSWHLNNDIPVSHYVLGHFYELGSNVFSGLADWGVEFIGIHMLPGSGYINSTPWLQAGPYRQSESPKSARWDGPVYYADYVPVPGHPELDNTFFNVVTEIRDNAGYEWYPDNDIPYSIEKGIIQSKRAFDSMALATLFTHEYFITPLSQSCWNDILQGVLDGLAPYNPVYVTMDDAARYIRAIHTSDISLSVFDAQAGSLSVTLSGITDTITQFYLFTGEGDGILEQRIAVPVFSGVTVVNPVLP